MEIPYFSKHKFVFKFPLKSRRVFLRKACCRIIPLELVFIKIREYDLYIVGRKRICFYDKLERKGIINNAVCPKSCQVYEEKNEGHQISARQEPKLMTFILFFIYLTAFRAD